MGSVELLVAGLVLVFVAILVGVIQTMSRREGEAAITEAQARENAAPLTTAIVASSRRERPGPCKAIGE